MASDPSGTAPAAFDALWNRVSATKFPANLPHLGHLPTKPPHGSPAVPWARSAIAASLTLAALACTKPPPKYKNLPEALAAAEGVLTFEAGPERHAAMTMAGLAKLKFGLPATVGDPYHPMRDRFRNHGQVPVPA